MQHRAILTRCALLVALLMCAGTASAQANPARFEAGIQLTSLRLNKLQEKPIGVGGRFHYNFSRTLAMDAEIDYFPENASGNFGETLALCGLRAGKRTDWFGVFAKARAGTVHFGDSAFHLRISDKTHAAFDLGGMFEYYPARHVALRVDASDVIIPYGNTTFLTGPPPGLQRLGTQHNLHVSTGVAARF